MLLTVLSLIVLSVGSLFIVRLQQELSVLKQNSAKSTRLLDELSSTRSAESRYGIQGRKLVTSNDANCSALVEQALISPGTIMDYAGLKPPAGYLFCNGSEVSRSLYPRLFNVIGVTYGVGDSIYTFNLPDFRGRTSVGVGHGVGLTTRTLNERNGEETHTLIISELPSHSHTDSGHSHSISDPGHFHSTAGSAYPYIYNDAATGGYQPNFSPSGVMTIKTWDQFTKTTGISMNIATSNIQASGSGQTHNNMQPYLAINKIIKF
jgi:microcystin-dependent protein